MAIQLDEIDVRLLRELETDADRPNVELARLIGLSPAATFNRVRRLKQSGGISRVTARGEPDAAGFARRGRGGPLFPAAVLRAGAPPPPRRHRAQPLRQGRPGSARGAVGRLGDGG